MGLLYGCFNVTEKHAQICLEIEILGPVQICMSKD